MSNYTDENIARMKELYSAEADQAARDSALVDLAEEFGTSVASVRGKLSSMGLYVAKSRAKRADGEASRTKAELVEALRGMLGIDNSELDSLVKATKGDLMLLHQRMVDQLYND